MAENNFLGLQPYTEDDAYRFKGRSAESQKLFRLIVRNDFTVCYAESGEGKTSLLNAGVFPLLRKNMYFPVAITFTSDDYKETPDNFDTIIDRCIKDSIAEYNEKNKGVNVEYKLFSTDFQSLDNPAELQRELSQYSWWKLRNYKPQAMGLTFTPVFVFDQFEEVFNMPGSIVWTKKFFDWLEDVSSDSCPDDIIKKVRSIIGDKAGFPAIKEDKDFKAVFSLRKEFIGELDYWGMQKCFIPSLKDNRYCLKALTYEGAKKVMTQQQRFDENKVEQVLKHFVGQYSREPEKTIKEQLPIIPALLLSVVCDSWEKDIVAFSKLSTEEISQSLNKVLEKFYDETIEAVINELTNPNSNTDERDSIRKDIDTAMFDLVDVNGKRVRIKAVATLGTILVTNRRFSETLPIVSYKEILNQHRIIKITKIDGEDYVEIVHDCLCPIIAKRREARLAEEAKKKEEQRLREQSKKTRRRIALLGTLAIVVIGIMATLFSLFSEREAREAIEAKNDSIQNLKTIVEEKNGKLRIDSAKLASHLFRIQGDSILLIKKSDSLQGQIIANQQKDKIIESLEALSKPKINDNVGGKLSERISPDLKYLITSLSVSGMLNGTDIALLRKMIIDGSLKHLDIENAQIVSGGDNSDGNLLITKGNIIDKRFFSECSRLISIKLPHSVTSIGDYAFKGCSNLTSVNIPNSVTSIGGDAFFNCSNLTSVNIPNSMTSIGDYAFNSCTGLNSITIPNSVTSIGDYAFRGCKGLNSITIPDSVTRIEESAFAGCSNLTSVNIPNSVTSIGDFAFGGCTGLKSITIPNSVTSIGEEAFQGCSSLTSVNIPNSVTSIGWHAFKGCSSLTSVNIPCNVTSIGKEAFRGCTDLKSITIPNSVTSIGDFAFQDCSSLTSVNIPCSVTSIGKEAFRGCTDLNSISIPNSVTSIGDEALFNGVNIIKCYITNIDSLEVWEHSFGYRDELKWIVPVGPKQDENKYINRYKSQPWWNKKWKIEHE